MLRFISNNDTPVPSFNLKRDANLQAFSEYLARLHACNENAARAIGSLWSEMESAVRKKTGKSLTFPLIYKYRYDRAVVLAFANYNYDLKVSIRQNLIEFDLFNSNNDQYCTFDIKKKITVRAVQALSKFAEH